jgi:hypothetical protein
VVEELVSQLRSEGLRRDAVLRDTSAFFLVGTRKQRSTSSHCKRPKFIPFSVTDKTHAQVRVSLGCACVRQ